MASLTSEEFAEWYAFYEMEPFGEIRADLRSAIVARTITLMLAGKKARVPAISDFMPNFEAHEEKRTLSVQDSIAHIRAFNKGLGGRDLIEERGGR